MIERHLLQRDACVKGSSEKYQSLNILKLSRKCREFMCERGLMESNLSVSEKEILGALWVIYNLSVLRGTSENATLCCLIQVSHSFLSFHFNGGIWFHKQSKGGIQNKTNLQSALSS